MKTKKSENKPVEKKKDAKYENFDYPSTEDIYNRQMRIEDINPDDRTVIKEPNEENKMNEKDYTDEFTGDDLDVPGAELDDKEEANGNEDEENNYYSLSDNK